MKLRWYQTGAVQAMLSSSGGEVAVLPTGSGKTLVMREYCARHPGRILVLSHIKEILQQNFETLAPLGGVGLYSAGLGMRTIDRITVAGIQSVYNKPHLFNPDVILIDECHLVNNVGMYKKLLTTLNVPYLGLTATPYRMKQGFLWGDQGMFKSKCYEAPVKKLTQEGFLSPLQTYGSQQELDTAGIKIQGGDFKISDMSLAFDRSTITDRILDELIPYNRDYKHWLLFCIDIAHAENVAEGLNRRGIKAEAVHSKSPRDQAILDFKAGKIQALVNVNILTVGFDSPWVDLIAVLRPTKSAGLHVQMLGRGLRVYPSKSHCLIKDFAGNLKRLGMIDKVVVNEPSDPKGKGGKPWTKECPDCLQIVHSAVRNCKCGHKFEFKHHLQETAFIEKINKWYKVNKVFYNIHHKAGGIDSLRVTYVSGMRMFREWVTLDHPGYAGRVAGEWVRKRWTGSQPIPTTVADLHGVSNLLPKPEAIQVEEGGKFPKILGYKW